MKKTVQSALVQIKEKNYDAELLARGIPKEKIRHYGFAFEEKNVFTTESRDSSMIVSESDIEFTLKRSWLP